MSSTIEKATLTAPDISCAHCATTLDGALGVLDGVRRVETSVEAKQVTVEFDPNRISREQLEAAMEVEGYPVQK